MGTKFSVPAALRGTVSMLFQSPRASTDPRQTLASIIGQPGDIASRSIDVAALAAEVGLTPDLLSRRPHQVSDGQLQRACLARSLAQQPKYLICDEATAMLDAATTAHAHSVDRESRRRNRRPAYYSSAMIANCSAPAATWSTTSTLSALSPCEIGP